MSSTTTTSTFSSTFACAPKFTPGPNTHYLISTLFDELERAMGKLTIRNLETFYQTLALRPELPIIITPLPFIAIEQVLFMSSVYTFEEMFVSVPRHSSAKVDHHSGTTADHCPDCCSVFFMPQFRKLLLCVSTKYGDFASDFIHVAGQVLSKIVLGCTSLVAVYCGRTLGDGTNIRKLSKRMRVQNIPSFLVQQWGERLDFRQTRIFEWRNCWERRVQQPPPFETRSSPPIAQENVMHRICKGRASDLLTTNEFCMDILKTFLETRLLAPILVRVYFCNPSSCSLDYITIRIRTREFAQPRMHYQQPISSALLANYDLILIKGQPFTNLDIDEIMAAAADNKEPFPFVKRLGRRFGGKVRD